MQKPGNSQFLRKRHNFDLEERTFEFARKVIKLCKELPQDTVNREIIAQLIRASCSVGANYREANDSLSKRDFIHRIRITRREAKESNYWLRILKEANPEYTERIVRLSKESTELKNIFSSIADKYD